MPKTISRRRPAGLAALLLPVACLALVGCGGSSSGSSSHSAAGASASASVPAKSGAPSGRRFSALRECLQKAGLVLPKRTPRQSPGGDRLGGSAGAPQLPNGVTRAQYEAAVKKCGGLPGGRAGPGPRQGERFKSPAFTQALRKFAACMRENGVNVPEPNTSGKGPIFSTQGLNPTSARFKAAYTRCAGALRAGLRARPGTGSPPATAG